MLHRSLKFIGAEPNDCVQFPDNHCNFQVIQLDSCSPQNIEMSEEKIICLIAPFALLHNIFETSWNGVQNLYRICLYLFIQNLKTISYSVKQLYFWICVFAYQEDLPQKAPELRWIYILKAGNVFGTKITFPIEIKSDFFKRKNGLHKRAGIVLNPMTFLLKAIGEIMQPLFHLLAFMSDTCRLQGKIIEIDTFEFTNFHLLEMALDIYGIEMGK